MPGGATRQASNVTLAGGTLSINVLDVAGSNFGPGTTDYQGTMITDRGTTYDAAELSAIKRQVCLAHVLRSISEVSEPY